MWANRSFCRLCECPVVDGGVPASQIDLDKFDEWCLRSLDTELADDLFEDDVFCNFCIWDADRELSLSDGNISLIWWPIIEGKVDNSKAALRSYYFDETVTPCSVKLDKIAIPESEEKEEIREEHYRNCIYCKKQITKQHLKRHVLVFHKDIAIFCEIRNCPTYFHSLDERKIHMVNVHGKLKKFPCVVCTKVFCTRYQYRQHMRSMHSDAHRCTIRGCLSYFYSKDESNSHFILVHKKSESAKIFECEVCNYKTSKRVCLDRHISGQHSAKTIKCDKCSKMFGSKSFLRDHIRQQHTFKVCKLCQQNVAVGEFRFHCTEHLCVHCKKKFPCFGKQKEHKKICEGTIFQCEKCPKQFKFLCLYNYHTQTHKENAKHLKYKSLGFKCEYCYRFYSSSLTLNRHLQLNHNKTSFVTCGQCSKKFSRISYLKNHLVAIHNTIECKYKCTMCAKTFLFAGRLKTHILHSHSTLTNEHKICQVCGKTLKVLQLPTHMLKIHGIRV